MSENHLDRRSFLKAASALTASAATALGASPQQARNTAAARQQYSLAHLTVLGCPPPEETYIAARAGYDFVSYRILTMHLPGEPDYNLAVDKELLRQTKKALSETGLKAHDIELARIQDNLDTKTYFPALDTAAELGAHRVITSIWTDQRNYAIDRLSELCDYGKKLGLGFALEFVTWSNCIHLQDALSVCRAVQRDNLGLLIDMLHFYRSRVKPEELDAVPRNWFYFAHICDAPKEIPASKDELIRGGREERWYPGEGAIDIASIVKRMPPVPFSLEIPHLARVKEMGYTEHAFRCLEAAKKYFAAHPNA